MIGDYFKNNMIPSGVEIIDDNTIKVNDTVEVRVYKSIGINYKWFYKSTITYLIKVNSDSIPRIRDATIVAQNLVKEFMIYLDSEVK